MDAELQTYLDQIAYVNLQLESDPTNDELVKLKTELNEIVNLTKEAIAQSSGSHGNGAVKNKGKAKETNPNWQDTGAYKAGMDCMAKYKDGKWYVYPDWTLLDMPPLHHSIAKQVLQSRMLDELLRPRIPWSPDHQNDPWSPFVSLTPDRPPPPSRPAHFKQH
jgi:hypothetical protein